MTQARELSAEDRLNWLRDELARLGSEWYGEADRMREMIPGIVRNDDAECVGLRAEQFVRCASDMSYLVARAFTAAALPDARRTP